MARSESEKDKERLERRHRKLKERVSQYEARLYLTTDEQKDLVELKKAKLATKDAIAAIRAPA